MWGNYLSFESFTSQIHKALENPLAYIRRRTPIIILPKWMNMPEMKTESPGGRTTESLVILRDGDLFSEQRLLSGSSQVSRAAMDRAVVLKKSNLKMSKKELMSQLEKEGIKLSDREVELIFAVYFNQFE